MMMMAEPIPITSPASLDVEDYNPIDHLNALFSQPSSLSRARLVSQSLQKYQDELDSEIADTIVLQAQANADSTRRMQSAKEELSDLITRIEGVRERAKGTEKTITDMTAEIKRLDSTKKNLTQSMTALKRLQMLTTAYEQLCGLIETRQYQETTQLLQAVVQLMSHFKTYRSINQIATLSKNVAETQRALLEQICEDFEVAFASGEVQQKRVMLAQACHVVDTIGDHARARLITWYCNTQLREYRQVFRGSDEAGSLDNISRRYSWFNRMLKTFDAEHAALFPKSWKIDEMLANAFCETTRDDYKSILQKSMRRPDGQAPDVELLLSCLQETLDFEHSLENRFGSGEPRASLETIISTHDEKRQGFTQAISLAFEPYLSVWVESQDRHLATLIPKYRQQALRNADDEFHSQLVISSSTELFHQYRVTFSQCAKLSTGLRLLELSQTFGKYLDLYSQQVLFYFLSDKSGGPSVEEAVIILNTADYCYVTTNQLEERMRTRIDEEFREKVDLQSQADSFMGVASAAIRALVQKTEADMMPAWREMRNLPWSKMDTVGDQSVYVSTMLQRVKDRSREILVHLHKPQYARAYCDNLVDNISTNFISNIAACKPVSETGAEQMLLDSYVLKKGLADLSAVEKEQKATPNQAFIKRINQSMAKLDSILKTLQVRSSPPEGLVQAYLIHVRDRSEANFRKILDLKGITRKQDQNHLIELFNAHKLSPVNESLPAANPILSALQLTAISSTGAVGVAALKESAAAHSTSSLPSRFDPANFGSALINAARDAGDRFSSPSSTTAGPTISTTFASRTTSPPPNGESDGIRTPTSLNENLKNIGKFFRRDVSGGFGGFGRRE